MLRKVVASIVSLAMLAGVSAMAGEKNYPPAPDYYSTILPDDSGKVKPIDKKSEKPIKIAVFGMESNPFWIPVKAGVDQAREELKDKNCTVDWIVPGRDLTADIIGPAIESAMVQQYDAVSLPAGDSGIAPFIDKAVKSGMVIAAFNSDIDKKNMRLFCVGADSVYQGQQAAKAMGEALGGKGKVAVITGYFSVESHEGRRKGFVDELAKLYPNIEIVGEVENRDAADVAYTQAKDFMNAFPDLNGMYVTAGGPFGAGNAIKDENKQDRIKLVCYDFVEENMKLVKEGVVYAVIGQQPDAQGHDPVIRLYNYIVGGVVPPAGRILTRADVVTKDNIDQFWP